MQEPSDRSSPKDLLGPMRLPFLILAPACVVLGVGTAVWAQGQINVFHAILAFVGAIAAHISVNVLNEYFDYRSGLDFKTERTPFSGGSGTLPAKPEMARSALITGLVASVLTGLIGLYFLTIWGLGLLPLGILGLIVILTYTSWITRYPLLCLLAPGLGFGTFVVMGTDYVLTGCYSWTAFFASLVPFFLVNDLLLLNQFPDVEADASTGRRHFPIVIGRQASSVIYIAFLALTYLSIIVGVGLGTLPAASLLGLITLLLAVPVSIGAYRYAENLEKLMPYLGLNILLVVATPILVAIGLFIAS